MDYLFYMVGSFDKMKERKKLKKNINKKNESDSTSARLDI